MKTLTICGSMRYAEQMKRISFLLEVVHGFNILQCVYDPEGYVIGDAEKQVLAAAHMKKIDMSDGIYVVDIDGYIGNSVKAEIAYAQKSGKEVIYHTQFGCASEQRSRASSPPPP